MIKPGTSGRSQDLPAPRPIERSPAGPRAGEPAPRRRRTPIWALGAAGALAAVAYAALFEKMRFGPPLVMLGLGGMTLAFTGAALWRVIDPLARAASNVAPVGRGPRRPRELEREKQLVLKAIKEIELDYQMRKIAERDYREMIERYRTRAMRLITEIEAGDDYRSLIERELTMRLKLVPEPPTAAVTTQAPPAVAAATQAPPAVAVAPRVPPAVAGPSGGGAAEPSCAACGTLNDADARFCKKCGARLGD